MAKCYCGRDAGWGGEICTVCIKKSGYYGNSPTFTHGKKVLFTQGFYSGERGILLGHNGEEYSFGSGGREKKYRIKLKNKTIVEEEQFNLELI